MKIKASMLGWNRGHPPHWAKAERIQGWFKVENKQEMYTLF